MCAKYVLVYYSFVPHVWGSVATLRALEEQHFVFIHECIFIPLTVTGSFAPCRARLGQSLESNLEFLYCRHVAFCCTVVLPSTVQLKGLALLYASQLK